MATSFSPKAKRDLAIRLGSQAENIIPELEQAIAACPTQSDFKQRIIPQWREHLRELAALGDDERASKIERWFDYSGWGQKGRPRNEARWWLANVVGYMLAWHGIRLTKSHAERKSGGSTGRFHQVLTRVIEAVEGKSPEPDNVADLVSATVEPADCGRIAPVPRPNNTLNEDRTHHGQMAFRGGGMVHRCGPWVAASTAIGVHCFHRNRQAKDSRLATSDMELCDHDAAGTPTRD